MTERAPASLTFWIAATLELPVASIGSSTIASRSPRSSGSFTKYSIASSVSSSRYMPMKPTRALEISDSVPSSIPTPARSTGQTATFFPEIRCAAIVSSGVSISTGSVGKSFVAS